jgi:hypothetical protein
MYSTQVRSTYKGPLYKIHTSHYTYTFVHISAMLLNNYLLRGRHGRDGMVVVFTTTSADLH